MHFFCHLAALAGLALAIVADSARARRRWRPRVGTLGAVAFAVFFVTLLRRMRGGTPAGTAGAGPAGS